MLHRRRRRARRCGCATCAAASASCSRTRSCSPTRCARTSRSPIPRRRWTQVRRAATLAGADEFVDALPDGYDTVIGEHGYSLSGGQRQRIAIARAVLADPRVLILDDATSSVDPTKEHEIRAALARGDGRAGRRSSSPTAPATIALADRVVLLDDGQVVADGTHDELLATSARYREVLAHAERAVTPRPLRSRGGADMMRGRRGVRGRSASRRRSRATRRRGCSGASAGCCGRGARRSSSRRVAARRADRVPARRARARRVRHRPRPARGRRRRARTSPRSLYLVRRGARRSFFGRASIRAVAKIGETFLRDLARPRVPAPDVARPRLLRAGEDRPARARA